MDKLSEKIAFPFFAIILVISAVATLAPNAFGTLGNIATLLIVIVFIAISAYQWYIQQAEVKETRAIIDTTSENTEQLKIDLAKVVDEGNKQREEQFQQNKKQEDFRNFVVLLINENLVSKKTLSKYMADRSYISVFCYQEGFKKPTKMPHTRAYNSLFDELHLVQLPRIKQIKFYIIAADNLFPQKLRDLDNLSDYILTKAKILLIEEWKEVLSWSKQKAPRFYKKYKDSPTKLNLNLLITKSNGRDMRHSYLESNNFNEAFNGELVSIRELNKLRVNEDEKVAVKNFVLESSINILILGLPENERKIILNLEPEFKKPVEEGGLAVQKFFEYHMKNKEDLVRILNQKFKPEQSNLYADLVMRNSLEYKDYLARIGVSI